MLGSGGLIDLILDAASPRSCLSTDDKTNSVFDGASAETPSGNLYITGWENPKESSR